MPSQRGCERTEKGFQRPGERLRILGAFDRLHSRHGDLVPVRFRDGVARVEEAHQGEEPGVGCEVVEGGLLASGRDGGEESEERDGHGSQRHGQGQHIPIIPRGD
jgi:hypothetical protein